MFAVAQLVSQRAQHLAGVAHHRDMRPEVLRDGRRVDIHVDYFGVRAEAVQLPRDPVIEAGSDGDQDVAVVHRHVCFIGSVHAEHLDELRVGAGECAEAHQRVGDGKSGQPREFDEFLMGATGNHPAAAVDDRTLGLRDQLGRPLDLSRMPLQGRLVGTHARVLRVGKHHGLFRHVLRDVHHHRSRPPGPRDVKRPLDRQRQVLHLLHQDVVLHAGPRDADRVDFLESVVADQRGAHLPGEHHQRHGVHVGIGNAGHGVGRARAGSHQNHPDFSGRFGIALGRMCRALLVAHQDVIHFLLLVQFVVDVKHGAAGVAKHGGGPFLDQAADEDFRAVQLLRLRIRVLFQVVHAIA